MRNQLLKELMEKMRKKRSNAESATKSMLQGIASILAKVTGLMLAGRSFLISCRELRKEAGHLAKTKREQTPKHEKKEGHKNQRLHRSCSCDSRDSSLERNEAKADPTPPHQKPKGRSCRRSRGVDRPFLKLKSSHLRR